MSQSYSLNARYREILKPFADKFEQMEMMLREISDEELEVVIEGAEAATGLNCWYQTFRAAQWLRKAAAEEQRSRQHARERARREAVKTGEPCQEKAGG